jgi:hypothetical protein
LLKYRLEEITIAKGWYKEKVSTPLIDKAVKTIGKRSIQNEPNGKG